MDSFGASVTQAEFGFSIGRQLGVGVIEGSLAYVSRRNSGDSNVSVAMIGDTNTIALDDADYDAAKLGFKYTGNLSNGMYFDVGGSAFVSGNGMDGGALSGSIGLKF